MRKTSKMCKLWSIIRYMVYRQDIFKRSLIYYTYFLFVFWNLLFIFCIWKGFEWFRICKQSYQIDKGKCLENGHSWLAYLLKAFFFVYFFEFHEHVLLLLNQKVIRWLWMSVDEISSCLCLFLYWHCIVI